MRLWLDVEDLFAYAAHHTRPSGVQRLCCELYAALVSGYGGRVGFLRHDPSGDGLRVIDTAAVAALYAGMAEAPGLPSPRVIASPEPRLRPRAGWLAREVRAPLGRAARAQRAALQAGFEALRAVPGLWRSRPAAAIGPDLRRVAQRGDVLAAFGSPWSEDGQAGRLARAAAAADARLAILVHDMIPLERPEFCDRTQIAAFGAHMRVALPAADAIFANSRATAAAIAAWARREGIALRNAPDIVPVGSRPLPPPSKLPAGLRADDYVLMVATLEARKNHLLAFRAWRRLIEDMPHGSVPRLVFAGRRGWMTENLLQALDNCAWLDGMIQWVEEPDDATLAALYRGCRFSLFPSHIEGWGLPVTESLTMGKPCIASGHGAIAEASAAFALPIDPDDTTGATAVLRRAIERPDEIAQCAARIRRDFQPTSWDETARMIMARLDGARGRG